jgi:uncharacterized protein (DUF427 family)
LVANNPRRIAHEGNARGPHHRREPGHRGAWRLSLFPAVRRELLEKAPRTASDLECPHSVQFYDVVIEGTRHARAAWSYEAPKPALAQLKDRFGFWNEVAVG